MSDVSVVCERLGHDEEVTHQDDESMTWVCQRCGAEWWEDLDDAR